MQPLKPDIIVEIHIARLPISELGKSFYSAENSGIEFSDQLSIFQMDKSFPRSWKPSILSELSLTPPIWDYKKK